MDYSDLKDVSGSQRCYNGSNELPVSVSHSLIVEAGAIDVLDRISRRASKVFGLAQEHSSHAQLLQYTHTHDSGAGVGYARHTDCVLDPSSDQREFTLLVYLNDVPFGGGTLFNHLNLTIQPERGMAVVFNSLYHGLCNVRSTHTAMPLLHTGRKSGMSCSLKL